MSVFCKAPWISMQVEQTGEYFPCCIHRHRLGNVNTDTWKEVWNGEAYRKFREDIFRRNPDVLEGCKACVTYEQWGTSQRQFFNNMFSRVSDKDIENSEKNGFRVEEVLDFLDVRFSNKCNLQCIMCGSHASSRWEEVKGPHPDKVSQEGLQNQIQLVLDNIHSLQGLRFAGGEPLLHKEHIEILQKILDRGRNDIRLVYNTNLTKRYFRGVDIFNLWNKFKQVQVTVSLDGDSRCDEYVRWGSKFGRVIQNIKDLRKVAPGVEIMVHPTVSVFNVLHLVQLQQELEAEELGDIHIHFGNILTGPREFDIRNLPKQVRKEIQRILEVYRGTKYWYIYGPIVQELEKGGVTQEESLILFRKLKNSITELDSRRGTDFFEINPEFKAWFQEIQ